MQRRGLCSILSAWDYELIINPETGLPWVPHTRSDLPERQRVHDYVWVPENPVPELDEGSDESYVEIDTGISIL
ncbi:MAG: hypothetical protein ACE5DM_01970 [Candidatus Nanoarchaeia archaeon]